MNELELNIRKSEREKIGRDLHDIVAPELLNLQFLLLKIEDKVPENHFFQISQQIEFIRKNIRSYSHSMIIPSMEDLSHDLGENIQDLLIDFTTMNTSIVFEYHIFPKNIALPIEIEKASHIILSVKELIINAITHGKSSEIEITLTQYKSSLTIMVTDNGRGFSTNESSSEKPNGIGLSNCEYRLKKIGGNFRIDSKVNFGTTATLEIPYQS